MRLCPKHKPGAYAAVMALVAVAALLLLPKPELLDAYTYSDRIYDRNGQLLHLGLSLDDKYRIRVPLQEIPPAARKALLLYEDRWFYEHPGVNPASMLRAVWQMLTGGRRQGASTLTMQVARIVYHIDSSSVSGKLLQIVRALQLEIFYSKDEILEAYFNLAPYGGNIEGIAAAAQVWFNTPVSRLNLPQILTLTVIPQNPVKRSPATPAGLKNAEAAAATDHRRIITRRLRWGTAAGAALSNSRCNLSQPPGGRGSEQSSNRSLIFFNHNSSLISLIL